jgi:4-amino-4-deoxy-L-arabinose transferase-like glycosyltransferase
VTAVRRLRLADPRYHPAVIRPIVTAVLLAVAAFFLYAFQLTTTPPSLSEDEVVIAMTAHSIATTGTDLFGRPWPLFLQMTAGSWYYPVIVYSIALVLHVLPLSEFAIRLPTVIASVTDVVLMYFVARVLFRREAAALLAAVLLALTPTHYLWGRVALECLFPLPFILGWLLCLFTYLQNDDRRWLFASAFSLGLGCYSYIGSVMVMPMYLGLTGLALLLRDQPIRSGAIAITGFALPLLAGFVPWLITHGSPFGHTVGHYLIYDTTRLNPLQGMRELFSHSSLAARTTTYWSYVNPSFLFIDLNSTFMYSTRTAGVFLAPLAVFLPVGLYQAFRSGGPQHVVLAFGFLMAPLAAAVVGEQETIGRALALLPFGVLLAVVGAVYLWSGPRIALRRPMCLTAGALAVAVAVGYGLWTLASEGRISSSTPLLLFAGIALTIAGAASDRTAARLAVVILLGAVLVTFQQYVSDYFGDYRARAAEAFLFNRRGGFEYLIDRSRAESVPAIYLDNLDRDVNTIARYWKFYLIKHGREDLQDRTVVLGESQPLDITTVPAKSLILARALDPAPQALATAGELTLETYIPEPTGQSFYVVYRR